jgi:DnaJ-class molecular chaperone
MEISLEEANSSATKGIRLQSFIIDADGQVTPVTRNYQVKIPKGITDGTRIRMTGKGGPGMNSGPSGDLLLKVNFIPHPRFTAVWTMAQYTASDSASISSSRLWNSTICGKELSITCVKNQFA